MSKTNSAPRAVLAEQIAAYIDLHFCEPALTLGKLSGIFHFNANYISYTFKEYVGTGVSRYIAKKRMEKAKREISHYNEYDYLIVNDVFDESVLALRSIVLAHRFELKRQSNKHKQLLEAMLEGYSK